ncbi:MAG: nucleotidyltransferase family protein [Planctomycetes bacterium]|nr:nucleotidyltransferase family protein [Planctomycetota bacterium]
MKRATALTILRESCPELQQRFGVKSLALFGSVARDESGLGSDVDILVEFEQVPGLSQYMAAKFWLEERLGASVDLVMRDALEDWARPLVDAEAIRVA